MTSGYQNSLVFHYLDTFPKPPGIPESPELIPEPTPHGLGAPDGAGPRGHRDSPEAAVRGRGCRCRQAHLRDASTTMPVEVAVEAVETFGAQVLPQFDKDPIHSTTRRARSTGGCRAGPGSRRGRARAAPAADLTREDTRSTARRVRADMVAPARFRIEVDDAVLDDLRRRLDGYRGIERGIVSDWSYGVPQEFLDRLVDRWRTWYDWQAEERA